MNSERSSAVIVLRITRRFMLVSRIYDLVPPWKQFREKATVSIRMSVARVIAERARLSHPQKGHCAAVVTSLLQFRLPTANMLVDYSPAKQGNAICQCSILLSGFSALEFNMCYSARTWL